MANTRPEERFNESKEHYESLTNLFKYCVTFAGIVFTALAFWVGFVTFKDGQEMRASQREARQDIRDNLKEMRDEIRQERDRMEQKAAQSRAELAEREKGLKEDVDNLVQSTNKDISTTRSEALRQIAGVKEEATSVARAEAKGRIEDVFKARNLESYIESVAKDKLDPRIQQIVDGQIKRATPALEGQMTELQLLTKYSRGFGYAGIATGFSIYMLDSLAKFATNKSVKNQALQYVTELRTNRSAYLPSDQNLDEYKKLTTDSLARYIFKFTLDMDVNRSLLNRPALVDLVYSSIKSDRVDALYVNIFFILFNKLTGANVPYFEYEKLDKAYKGYRSRNK